MGREIKRVALDFDWPRDRVWEGFTNCPGRPCPNPQCDGGQLAVGWFLQSLAYKLFQAGYDAHTGATLHPWTRELPTSGGKCFPGGKHPDGLADLIAGLAGKTADEAFSRRDGLRDYMLMEALAKHAGLDESLWRCSVCDCSGIHPEDKEAHDAWEPTEPPAGEGWQVWETVSEGSPVSPVMKTPEALAKWMTENDTSVMEGTSYEHWLAFIHEGWAPSMMSIPGHGLVTGVEGVALSKSAEGGDQ